MRTMALSFVLLLAGCVSAPDVCVSVRSGQVCASTLEAASAAGEQMDALEVALRARLPGLREPELDVWLQPVPQVFWFITLGDHVAAFRNHWTERIHAREGSEDLEVELAHEMVHALLDESWDGLPPTLEEGLCDQIASRVTGKGADLRADRLIRAMAAAGGPPTKLRVELPAGGWAAQQIHAGFRLDEDFDLRDAFSRKASQVHPLFASSDRAVWYGAAFVAVGRLLAAHGAAGLRQLCIDTAELDDEAATVMLSEAAGLGADPDAWKRAILAEFSPRALEAMAVQVRDALVEATLGMVPPGPGGLPTWAGISVARPSFSVQRGNDSVDLLDVPEYVEALEEKIGPRPAAE
jgi:hypothetical protein